MTRRLLLVLFPLLVLASSCSSLAVAAATVNGDKITETEVESEIDVLREDPVFGEALRRDPDTRGQRRREILGELIYQSIAEEQARRLDVRVSDEQVDNLIERSARSRGITVEKLLEEERLSREEAERVAARGVRRFALMDKVVPEVDVDEQAVREVYEGQQDRFMDIHLERATAPDVAAARRLLEEPDTATFEDMGYIPLTDLEVQVQGAIAPIKEGNLTDPIEVESGFEVYRVVDRRIKSFKDAQEEIRSSLTQDERDRRFDEWLIARVREADIVVNPKYGRFDKEAERPAVVPSSPELRP